MEIIKKISLKEMVLFSKALNFLLARPFESAFFLILSLFYGLYALAVTHLFYKESVLFLFGSVFLFSLFLLSKNWKLLLPRALFLILSLLFLTFFAFLSHPIEPIAGGRDQGTFIHSSILLTQNNGFPFQVKEALPFFEIYGAGKALNFPGFTYNHSGALVPEFPLGYIAWLAGFYTLFGIYGFSYANGLLFILSGTLFFVLLKRHVSDNKALLATILWMGGFLPLWFLSFTLTENLALFLFLLTAESLTRFYRKKTSSLFLLTFTSALALALTRIEGWAVLILLVLFLTFQKDERTWCKKHILTKVRSLIFLLFFACLIVQTLSINSPYFKTLAKALLKDNLETNSWSTSTSGIVPLYSVLWEYGIFIPLVLGMVSAWYLWKRNDCTKLIPFFLSFAAIPYLFFPHITFDTPWMLRRFLFILYPACSLTLLFAFNLLLTRFTQKKQQIFWFLLLFFALILQFPLIKFYVKTSYSDTLLPQTESLASQFTSEDLLLIDKGVTGDSFMMPNQILSQVYNKPSVYFFNQQDFAKLNTDGYSRVFLIFPEDTAERYASLMNNEVSYVNNFYFYNDHSFKKVVIKEFDTLEKNTLKTRIHVLQLK